MAASESPASGISALLVLLLGRVWRSHRLLLFKAAPEEGEHRVHHVVAALGGGDFVPLVWKNLCGRKMGKHSSAHPLSLFILPLGQTSSVSGRTRRRHSRTHFREAILLFIFTSIIYDVQSRCFFWGGKSCATSSLLTGSLQNIFIFLFFFYFILIARQECSESCVFFFFLWVLTFYSTLRKNCTRIPMCLDSLQTNGK